MANYFKKKLLCCEKCQDYWVCETKWYRGEVGQENVCCPLCSFYRAHWLGAESPQNSNAQKNRI